MSERKDPRHTRGAVPGPERVNPRSGLEHLKKAMRKILKVNKIHLETQKRPPTPMP